MVTGSFSKIISGGNINCTWLGKEKIFSLQGYPIRKLDYLHGHCTELALALHDVYGYDIVRLYNMYDVDECGCYDVASIEFPFVHDFCICGDVCIDIRGATDEFENITLGFEDLLDRYGYKQLEEDEIERIRGNCIVTLGLDVYNELYSHAVEIIKRDKRIYDVRKHVKYVEKYFDIQ